MAFVDELTIYLQAGRGGDGVVRWLHLKGKEFSGPAGGNGGKGGDVYIEAVRDSMALQQHIGHTAYKAGDGEAGRSKSQEGKNGSDFIFSVPRGSIVTNTKTGMHYEVLTEGERVCVLRGGAGGFGNEHFKSSRNVKPIEATQGKSGEEADFYIELHLIADAGLIGLPSAGKSSLLNALTHAHAKTGAYHFTTLEPNLGDFYGYTLADIPGLIEGASKGKGLGHTFLRHITRTKKLIHLISLEEDDVCHTYTTIRNELRAYDPALVHKDEIIVLTKSDMVDEEKIEHARKVLASCAPHKEVFVVSIIDDVQLKAFSDALARILHG